MHEHMSQNIIRFAKYQNNGTIKMKIDIENHRRETKPQPPTIEYFVQSIEHLLFSFIINCNQSAHISILMYNGITIDQN